MAQHGSLSFYRCFIDYQCWIVHSDARGDAIRRAKKDVLGILENEHGHLLDQCATAGGKKRTSTDGGQDLRSFSEEVVPTLEKIVPEHYKNNLLLLHKQLSVILRIVSYTGQINVEAYEQVCQDFSVNLIRNFDFAQLNDTMHAIHHSKNE